MARWTAFSILFSVVTLVTLPALGVQYDEQETSVILRRKSRQQQVFSDQNQQLSNADRKTYNSNSTADQPVQLTPYFATGNRFEPTPAHVSQQLSIAIPEHAPILELPAPNRVDGDKYYDNSSSGLAASNSMTPKIQDELGGLSGGCGANACGGGCCLQYRNMASFDAMFLNYHKQGGVAVGLDVNPGDDGVDFDIQFSPRVTLRHAIDNKYHCKARWFSFAGQQTTLANPNSYVDVETYNIDVMFGRKFCLGEKLELEFEGGGRWWEFREDMFDNNDTVQLKQSWTKQAGLILGGSLTRRLAQHFSLYAQGYIVYSEGDYYRQAQTFQNDEVNAYDIHSYEASIGFQFDRRTCDGSNFFVRAGADFFDFQNLGSAFDNGNDETLAGFRDVQLNGFSFRFGWQR